MGYGVKSTLGLRFQATYGEVPQASNTFEFFEFMTESVTEKVPPLKVTGMRGIFDEGETEPGAITIDGDINIESRALDCGVMLKAMFGEPVTSQIGATGVYTHVWIPNQEDFSDLSAKIPFSLHKHLDVTGNAAIFNDMNASMMEWQLANGDFLKTKMTVVGGGLTELALDTAVYKTGRRFTWDQTSVSLGGVANCDFRELTVAVDDSLEAQHTLCNSAYPSRIKRTDFRKITVGATLVFRTNDEVAAFRAQAERPLVIHTRGKVDVGSGNFESLQIELPLMRYIDIDPAASSPGSLEISTNSDGKYSLAAGHGFRITLVNTETSYAI